MKAIVQDRYGSTDTLHLDEIDTPTPGEDDVLVQVRAAGVDPGVWHLMTGLPYLARVIGFGFSRPKDRVRGRDVAGTVVAVGAGVTRLQPGDDVYGTCEGSYAEFACAGHDRFAVKPAGVTFEQAAAVPISGMTALQALRKGGIEAGQHVLVIGAGGGVGTFAVQIAKALGAEVTGVCSTAKIDLVRRLGADDVIDYTTTTLAATGRRFDLIIDTAGRRSVRELRGALTPKGTLVIVGGEGKGRLLQGLDRGLRASLLSLVVSQRLTMMIGRERLKFLDELSEMMADGRVTPAVDRTYPLADAPDAIDHLHAGQAAGKLVIVV